MKQTHKSSQRKNAGYALLITVIFIGIALLLLGSVMNWSNSSARQTERNNLYGMSTAAAEAATERVVAQMTRDFYSQTFQTATNYTSYYPAASDQSNWKWPVTYSFTAGPGGTANKTSVTINPQNWSSNWTVLGNQFAGLWAAVAQCTVISTATAQNQPYSVPATVQEQFQLASIPLFQFAIFYNMNMEICPGANMTVNGKTHVNGSVWADPGSPNTLTFGGRMETTATNIFYTRNPNDQQSSTPNPSVVYTDTNSPVLSAPALVLPVGTNSFSMDSTNSVATNSASSVAAILDLPPTNVTPYSVAGQAYLYNQADIIISNSASGKISAFYQNSNNVNALTFIPYDVTNTVSHITNYSFVTNVSFYDYRESDTVKAVQLDVGKFNTWLSGKGATFNNQNNSGSTSKGHTVNSVYVYNGAPFNSTNLPAVRVSNGATLPSQGLTVGTPFPIYILGNYNASASDLGKTNVADTAPAAFLGDSITILSSNWKDTNNATTSLNSRTPAATTVNAATMEGIVESTTVGGTKHYSGGVENFLRLMENWSSSYALTYNGSIVVMFDSRYATNFWQQPGNYYNPPTRNWGFDVNFQNQNQLPPMTPQVKALVRQGWSTY